MSEQTTQIGAQMFTLRAHTKTMPAIRETLATVRNLGYRAIQISGFGPVDPGEVAQAVAEQGLTVAATHMPWQRFREEIEEVIETHKQWGCSHAAIGSLPKEYFSLEGIHRFHQELEPVARKLAEAGIDFSYHNHSHELVKYNGKTWLERLYEEIPAELLQAEIDVYWITAGGGDPAQWIRWVGPRQPLVHVKDMSVLPDRTQRFAPVGDGNLNWPKVLEACRAVGVEWYLVEQDDTYEEDPFDCLGRSLTALRKMGLS